MLYRLGPVNKTYWKSTSLIRNELPEGVRYGISFHEYGAKFEEVSPESPIPNCKLFKAPLVAPWHFEKGRKFGGKISQLPHFFSLGPHLYVSPQAKEIIESLDGFPHQFKNVSFCDKKEVPLQGVDYFRLFVRRYMQVDKVEATELNIPFLPREIEKEFLPAIKSSKELHDDLTSFPIWRYVGQEDIFYLNEKLFKSLCELDSSVRKMVDAF